MNINNNQDIDDLSPRKCLRYLKLNNVNKIVSGHLNINSIRNKFDGFKYLIDENIDIILWSDTFPVSQLIIIHGFHLQTKGGGGGVTSIEFYLVVEDQ